MTNAQKNTRKKILKYGKKEFLEKGYQAASLRNIAKMSGVTTGAFYVYFPDKNALFEALVEPVTSDFYKMFEQAQDEHAALADSGVYDRSVEFSTEKLRFFVEYIYAHFDEFKLLLTGSEGTSLNGFIHSLIELEVGRNTRYLEKLHSLGLIQRQVSPAFLHLLTSAYFNAIFEIVIHDMKKEEAVKYLDDLSTFFNAGWERLFGVKDDCE